MFINHLSRTPPSQTSLDGEWRFALDPDNRGKELGWQGAHGPPADAGSIRVPSCWEETHPGYDGVAWYWRDIDPAPRSEGDRILLLFDAVNYYTEAWLDGQPIGQSEGGYTPFSFDITQALDPARSGRLAVRVLCPPKDEVGIDGFALKELPCWRSFESFNFGGIWQSVRLLTLPPVHVQDCFVQPNEGLDGIHVQLELADAPGGPAVGVTLEVHETAGRGLVGSATRSYPSSAAASQDLISVPIRDPKHWSPEEPNLYVLRVRVEAEGRHDEGEVTFGLRRLTFEDNRICLNGEPYFVKGGFHEGLYPVGLPRPTSRAFVEDELRKVKDTGFNLLRYWQIPIHPFVLDAADELGMMLMDEPPIEWMTQTDDTPRRCRDEVARLVRRDRNRPSVVFWTILNETGIQPDFNRRNAVSATQREWEEAPVQQIRDELCDLAHSLDPTRLTIDDSGGFMSHANIYVPGAKAKQGFNDLHRYCPVPIPEKLLHGLREVGSQGGRFGAATVLRDVGVLMSEFGYGSFPNFDSILSRYEQANAAHTEDCAHHRALAASLHEGFDRHGMGQLFESVADLVEESQRVHAAGNALQTMALRANPLVSGYVMHAFSAGGCIIGAELFDTWREPKLVAHAVRAMQQPHILAAFFDRPAVAQGEAVRVSLFSARDCAGPGLEGLHARVTVVAPSAPARKIELGPARLSERVDAIWLGDVGLGPEPGAHKLHFELVTDAGQCLAEVTREAVVVPPGYCDVQGPVAFIGGDHIPGRRVLERRGVATTHNASLASVVVSAPRSQRAPLPEGYRELLSGDRTLVLLAAEPQTIQWALDTFGIDGDVRTGVGNWSPVSHYFVDKSLQDELPADRLLGQAYAGVTPRHVVATEAGRTLAGCLSYIRGHIVDKQYDFWWGKGILELPMGRARLILCTYDLASQAQWNPVAARLLCNLVNYAGSSQTRP